MKSLQVIEKIKQDCKNKGRGRKKWWAENLGVNQVTLSYWLHGQRSPRSLRMQQISDYLSIMDNENDAQAWASFLRKIYFSHQAINRQILADALKSILSTETVDSRLLAFMSYILENSDIDEIYDDSTLLRNRLGWLLEVSGKCPSFKPVKSRTMPLVDIGISYSKPKVIGYLKSVQTKLGKRWHVYDTDIKETKGSFIGRLSTDS